MPLEAVMVETPDYRPSPLPLRDDLVAAQRRAWVPADGTGRVVDGRGAAGDRRQKMETRAATDCRLCQDRKAALSPYAVTGSHTAATNLPDILIDVIHRIRTDADA